MLCPGCQAHNESTADTCRKCGKGLFALTDGSVLAGRYEIVQPLGRGGMGLVYKALDRELDEVVALKVLRADLTRADDLTRRFRSEIRFARKVRHPNVCAIHEYGQQGHMQFIVMEYVEGVDLKQLIRRDGPFPAEEGIHASIQVARGLRAVHSAGIVHRDLKTANIMRDSAGVVRLMDFGIAKRLGAETVADATATGQVLGTPEYMSPEQARAEKLDARSDIYAFGIVIYELFTGDVPFRGETPIATLFKHIQEPPPLDGAKASRIPFAIIPVLRRALAKNRDDRFASADEMLIEIERVAASGPLHLPMAAVGNQESSVTMMVTPTAVAARPPTPSGGVTAATALGATVPDGTVASAGTDVGAAATNTADGRQATLRGEHSRPDHGNARRAAAAVSVGVVAVVASVAVVSMRRAPLVTPMAPPSAVASAIAVVPTTLAPAETATPAPRAARKSPPRLGGTAAEVPTRSLRTSPAVEAGPPFPQTNAPVPQAEQEPGLVTTSLATEANRTSSADTLVTAKMEAAISSSAPLVPPVQPLPVAPADVTSGPGSDPGLLSPGPGVMPPRVLRTVQPEYPMMARRLNRETTLLVRVLVDAAGRVGDAEIQLGDASGLGFNEAALEAARKTTFRAATKNGVPGPMWTNLPVVFSRR
jgi:TonB family protein